MRRYLYAWTENEKAEVQALKKQWRQVEEDKARFDTLEAKERDEVLDRISDLGLRTSYFRDKYSERILKELYDGSYAFLVEELKTKIKVYIIFEYLKKFQAIKDVDIDDFKSGLKEKIIKHFDILFHILRENNYMLQEVCTYINNSLSKFDLIIRPVILDIQRADASFSAKWELPYRDILENNVTNSFSKILKISKDYGELDFTGEDIVFSPFRNNNRITIKIVNYKNVLGKSMELPTSLMKLLDMLVIEFTDNLNQNDEIEALENNIIFLPVSAYKNKLEIENVTDAKKQIERNLGILMNILISFEGKIKNNEKYSDVTIIEDYAICKGVVAVCFSNEFVEMLKSAYTMPYPLVALEVGKGGMNRNSYYIVRRLAEHVRINKDKTRRSNIKVRTLLASCPALPTEDKVPVKKFDEKIMKPFLEDLNLSMQRLYEIEDALGKAYSLKDSDGFDIDFDKTIKNIYGRLIDGSLYIKKTLPNYPND